MNIKKRLLLYSALLLAALLAMLALSHLSSSRQSEQVPTPLTRDYPQIREEGVLRVLSSFESAQSDSSASSLSGQVYDLAKDIAARTTLQVKVVLENSQGKSLDMLERGEVDLIAYNRVRTSDIDTMKFTWIKDRTSGPIYLVQRRDTLEQVSDHLDLAGKVITLPQRSDLLLFVRHLEQEMGINIGVEQDGLYGTEQLIILVASGKKAYTLCTSAEAQQYRDQFLTLDFSLPMSYSLREGWLVRRSSPILADSLSRWL